MKAMESIGIAVALCCAPLSALALCSYNGVDNAKTTLQQEFRDSRWVVRVRVLSAVDHWSDTDDSWTSYEMEVTHRYKGLAVKRLRFFTFRNSGGFYMDRPWVNLPAGHDIGGEYLLFLNPVSPAPGDPAAAKGAVFVNYSCGRSGPWSKLPASSRRVLSDLEQRR